MRLFTAKLALVTLVALVSCIGASITADAQDIHGAHYELQLPDRPRVVVFVHGFTGNAETTWRAGNGASFASLFAKDDRVKHANVFVASYDTHWTQETGTIAKLADKLYEQLDTFHVAVDHKDLAFVCHSLGGLIVERMLINHPEMAAKTSFIQFFGTPHEGAFTEAVNIVASFVAAFGSNTIIPELRAGSSNLVLVQLDKDWREKNLGFIHRFCALEAYPTRYTQILGSSGLVVPYFSGAYGCDNSVPVETVYADHIGMVKTSDRVGKGNEAYAIFMRNYREYPYYEVRIVDDATRDRRDYLDVDCNHTKSDDLKVPFNLNPLYKEELLGATARLETPANIKDIKPNPPVVEKIAADIVLVHYGFNGEDKDWKGSCPGGGHATLVVHPQIQAHIPVPDAQ